jgi:hypothetical protein
LTADTQPPCRQRTSLTSERSDRPALLGIDYSADAARPWRPVIEQAA